MRASSVRTLTAMVAAVDKGLGAKSKDGITVAEEYFALSELFEGNIRLSRNLSDPARTASEKQALAEELLGKQLSSKAMSGIKEMAAGRWSSEQDLSEVCRMLAKHVLLKTALDTGQLDEVERDIFAMGQVIAKHRELRNFLTDSHRAPVEKRLETFNSLVGKGVNALALRLLDAVIEKALPGRLASDIRALLDSAAQIRSHGMATVFTAVELTDTQQSRLIALLSKQAGHDVEVNVVVDPDIVGGLKVQYGDTVMDGALTTRATEIKRKLAS